MFLVLSFTCALGHAKLAKRSLEKLKPTKLKFTQVETRTEHQQNHSQICSTSLGRGSFASKLVSTGRVGKMNSSFKTWHYEPQSFGSGSCLALESHYLAKKPGAKLGLSKTGRSTTKGNILRIWNSCIAWSFRRKIIHLPIFTDFGVDQSTKVTRSRES